MRISDWSSDVCSSDLLADLGKGIVVARIVIERLRAAVGGEVISPEPVLPQHNRIGGNGADLFVEASKVERHLWIGRAIIDIRRGDGLCLSGIVDLDHPGRDLSEPRVPDDTARKPQRKPKHTAEGDP